MLFFNGMDNQSQANRFGQWTVAMVLLCVIAAFAYFLYSFLTQQKQIPPEANQPIAVETTHVTQTQWQTPFKTFGVINSQNLVQIAAETSGRVVNVTYAVPEHVKKGELLFQIFNQNVEGQLRSDLASLKLSKINLGRQRQLYLDGAVAKQDYDNAVQSYEYNLGQVKADRANLSLGNIYAPVDGYLGANNPNVGEYVNAGNILATLSPLKQMEVQFNIPAIYVASLHAWQELRFTTPMAPHKVFHASMQPITSAANFITHQISLYGNFNNSNPMLLPGQYVDVTIDVGPKQQVFVVPETALVYSLGGINVFIVDHGKAKYIPVKVVQRRDTLVGVMGALSVNDQVISFGSEKLSNGTAITTLQSDHTP